MASAIRNYKSITTAKTLATGITGSATSMTINETSEDFPPVPFTLVIEPGVTGKEEIVTVTGVSGSQLTITRGEEGLGATDHIANVEIRHMATGRDFQDARDHIDSTTNFHGISSAAALVTLTGTQTLQNKTLTSPSFNNGDALTATSTELNYVDGVTSGIQTQINTINSAISALEVFPKGMISPYGGASAPTGWLMCDGSAVSRTTYSALFAVIGTAYGSGDSSTTFNVPDLLGRTPIGAGSGSGLTARTLGQKVGVESTVLTSSHIPQHSHTIDHGHGNTINISTGGSHAHSFSTGWTGSGTHDHAGSATTGYAAESPDPRSGFTTANTHTAAAHDHGFTGGVTDHAGSSGNYGTASPTGVSAMQPSTVVNFIIKH